MNGLMLDITFNSELKMIEDSAQGTEWDIYGSKDFNPKSETDLERIYIGDYNYAYSIRSDLFEPEDKDFTIDCWVRFYQWRYSNIAFCTGSGKLGFYRQWDNGKLLVQVITSDQAIYTSSNSSVSTDPSWHHISIERYKNKIAWFIDGKKDIELTITGPISGNGQLYFGRWVDGHIKNSLNLHRFRYLLGTAYHHGKDFDSPTFLPSSYEFDFYNRIFSSLKIGE